MHQEQQIIADTLRSWFDFPKQDVFCQLATTNQHDVSIRTLKLYDLKPNGDCVFLSRQDTRKCEDISSTPRAAICIYHPFQGQIIVNGRAQVVRASHDPIEVKKYWLQMPANLREIYCNSLAAESIPDSFCVILLMPDSIELLQTNQMRYGESKRIHFQKHDHQWHQEVLKPV